MGREVDLNALLNFTPRQWEAWGAMWDCLYVLYGGARGGGKSRFLRWGAYGYLAMLYKKKGVKNARVMLASETYKELEDRHISKFAVEFPPWMGELKNTKEDGLCFFLPETLGSGKIALRNLDDPSKYMSAEFAGAFIDELTKQPETKYGKPFFDVIRASLRWPSVSRPVFVAATNPGEVGHAWVKRYWIDRDFPPELTKLAHEFRFVQCLPKDNPHLEQTYWDVLDTLTPDLRRAWVEGDWSVFTGQAFSGWRHERHVIKPFEIPVNWLRLRGVDWGYTAPFCCLWGAKDPDTGRIYIYREAYAKGLHDRAQAQMIRDMTLSNEIIGMTYADPSMWGKKVTGSTVTTSAEEYMAEGIPLTKADNDRINGKRKIDRMLANLPDGMPGIQVFENCTNLTRTLPALPYDDNKPEDVDTDAEDHAYDAMRYLLTGIRSDVEKPREPARNPWLSPALKGVL